MRLDPKAAAAGVRLAVHDELGSTNAKALEQARAGEAGPLWITAKRQTAGRGRQGRSWVSEPGNLYATLLLTDPAPPRHAAQLSFVAALAAHDAVVACAPAVKEELAIKWPNDLLLGGRKLAGILIEGENFGGRLAAAIGIGVNCLQHPDDAAFPATNLAAFGAAVSCEDLFMALSAAMLSRLAQWNRGEGFAAIRADWLARAAGRHQAIRVRLPDRELAGEFDDIDAAGRLVLRRADGGIETIAAGDVFPIPPLKGEGRIAEGNPGKGRVSQLAPTATRRASCVDLPLAGGGKET